MNRLRAVAVAVLMLTGCPVAPQFKTTPAVTEVGEPTGAMAVSAIVGASGGTLTSGDGQFELAVPAGALATATTLTMTPITAKGPGAIKAWRLGPEGTTFSQAASVRFKANEIDLAGSGPASLRIAYQDTQRQWRTIKDSTLEGNTITVKTTHLSDWSALHAFQLKPPQASVRPKGTVELVVWFCNYAQSDDGLVGLLSDCQDDGLETLVNNWEVNGITKGNAEIGTLSGAAPITYTAPAVKPASNPVAVSVEFVPPGSKKGLLVAHIEVGQLTYRGNYSGRLISSNYTLDTLADLAWRPVRETKEENSYRPVGSVHITYTQKNCDAVTGTFPIDEGELALYPLTSPVYPGQYRFTFTSTPTVMVTCRDPMGMNPVVVAAVVPVAVIGGMCANPAGLLSYAAESQLTGSERCGETQSSRWTWDQVVE